MLPKKVNLAILALLVFEAQSPGSREKRVLWGFEKYQQPVEGPLKSPYIVNSISTNFDLNMIWATQNTNPRTPWIFLGKQIFV